MLSYPASRSTDSSGSREKTPVSSDKKLVQGTQDNLGPFITGQEYHLSYMVKEKILSMFYLSVGRLNFSPGRSVTPSSPAQPTSPKSPAPSVSNGDGSTTNTSSPLNSATPLLDTAVDHVDTLSGLSDATPNPSPDVSSPVNTPSGLNQTTPSPCQLDIPVNIPSGLNGTTPSPCQPTVTTATVRGPPFSS